MESPSAGTGKVSRDGGKVIRALPTPLSIPHRPFGLRWPAIIGLGALAAVNAVVVLSAVLYIALWPNPVFDWWLIGQAHERIGTGTMYEWEAPNYVNNSAAYLYRYSPLLPYLMTPFLWSGLLVWRLIHFAALLLLPRRVALLVLISGPFWYDVASGNVLTFGFVLAWLALDGKRWAMVGYFALVLLIPRPLMLPVAAWLIWQRPKSRLPAAVAGMVMLALTAATGDMLGWLGALRQGGDLIGTWFDWGPSHVIGTWWLLIGLPLGAWLTWTGRLGLASLAVSPYLLPYYFIMALLELRRR